jgi:hypothetical protein
MNQKKHETITMGKLHQAVGSVARRVWREGEPVLVTFWREPYVAIVPADMLDRLKENGQEPDHD